MNADRPGRTRPGRLQQVAAAVVSAALSVAFAAPAGASWSASAAGDARTKSRVLPGLAGTPNATSGSAGSVDVSWGSEFFFGDPSVTPTGYFVYRTPAGGGATVAAGGTCAGEVTTLSCTDMGVPTGDHTYSIRPLLHEWFGGVSTASASVSVA